MRASVSQFTKLLVAGISLILFTQLQWMYTHSDCEEMGIRVVASILLGLPISFGLFITIATLTYPLQRRCDVRLFAVRFLSPLSLLLFFIIPFFEPRPFPLNPFRLTSIVVAVGFFVNTVLLVRALIANPNKADKVTLLQHFFSIIQWYGTSLKKFLYYFTKISQVKVSRLHITLFPLTWFILLIQAFTILHFLSVSTNSFIDLLLLSISTILTTMLIVDLIMHISPKAIRVSTALLVTAVYSILTLYHHTQKSPLDYSLFIANLDLVFYPESGQVILDNLSTTIKITSLIFIGGAIGSQLFFQLFSSQNHKSFRKRELFVKSLLLMGLLLFVPINADAFSNFIFSVKSYRDEQVKIEKIEKALSNPFPYLHESKTPFSTIESEDKPNIILVSLESFNGLMIDDTTHNGKEITPFLNTLSDSGLVIKQFYGNSIQTSRGLFALHAGILPSFRNKVMTHHDSISLYGIPQLLNDNGYETFFIKAYHSLAFDNNGPFMEHMGFKHVLAMTKDRIKDVDKEFVWGWGLQDNLYYKKCLNIVDSVYKTDLDLEKTPFFLSLLTVTNHMKFDHLPQEKKLLHPTASKGDHRENLENSMHLTDLYLRNLFGELEERNLTENTLVIITGDHSFPRGDFGIYNQSGYYEENFRTPFVMIWKGKIEPQVLEAGNYSQIDIAPTLLDILGISTKNHFQGLSLFAPQKRPPVLLSQPYTGLYLISVDYPYKYVTSTVSQKEYLFDISTRNGEKTNLIKVDSLHPLAENLRASITQFYINQALIEKDRIWPRGL